MDEIAHLTVSVTRKTLYHVTQCLELVAANLDGLDRTVQKVNDWFLSHLTITSQSDNEQRVVMLKRENKVHFLHVLYLVAK